MTLKRRKGLAIMLIVMACWLGTGLSEVVSCNPLLTPPVIENYTETPDDFLNVLFLGIDYGYERYYSAGYKDELEECHTDAILVASFNLSQKELSLVSLPRDSLTYVPGVRGIYKLNAAINCGDTIQEGLKLTCDAVSWHLGGIEIHSYIAVDVPAMIALGDAIGGVDFDLDMSYSSGDRSYQKGFQHLNGQGIMDYVRARKNATRNGTDLGRTERQRRMMSVVFKKIKDDPSLIMNVLSVMESGEHNIFTDLSVADGLKLIPTVMQLEFDKVETYGLDGPYRRFAWNFTFNDQENRREVIRTVYGIDVPAMEYVSYDYTKWLKDEGLRAAKYINTAKTVLEYARQCEVDTPEHRAALQAMEQAYDETVVAFDKAAATMDGKDKKTLISARKNLYKKGQTVIDVFEYPRKLYWSGTDYWYSDPMINERQLNWH